MFGKNFGVNFSVGKDGLKINGQLGARNVEPPAPEVKQVEQQKPIETNGIAAAMFKEKQIRFTCNEDKLPVGLVDLVIGMASTLTLTLEHVNLREREAIEKQSYLIPGLIQMVEFIQQFQRFTIDNDLIEQVYEATKMGNIELLYRGIDTIYLFVLPEYIKPLKKYNKSLFLEEQHKIDEGLDLNHAWQGMYEEIAFSKPIVKE